MDRVARPKLITCPAGQWTAIFDHAFVQMPNAWTVYFSGGEPLEGEVAVKKSSWIFRKPAQVVPLQAVMHFERGWFNTFFSVRVRPVREVRAEIR
jgi:hypothetical protein